MPVSGNGDIIEFGRFRLRRRDRTLLADGVKLDLGARAIDVLLALIDAGETMLSKDELLSRVWPDAIVEENNLHVQVFALRRALGADRDLIRTVPRHGYRFTGHVTAAARSASAAQVGPGPTVSSASNLPIQVGELIGREADLQQVVELQTTYRLLTLTGPGGIGKTSLALAAAWRLVDRYPDGVWLADLATLADPNLVLPAIAAVLDLRGLPSPLLPEHVAASLESRRLLLLLDTCEHLIEPVVRIAEALLHGAPYVQLLATSREPLRAEGECVYHVPALAVPGDEITDTEAQLHHSAVRLFVARARLGGVRLQVDDDRARTISGICRRLDGIPLAIELAAARAVALGVRSVAAGLDDRFRLLTGGRRTALPRQQTLRATLDWSYELLSKAERAVLRRLAIFPGGFELEAAEAIVATTDGEGPDVLDSLANLVAKSLITRDGTNVPVRYRLLDTTLAYAREKLEESGEFAEVARRHAEYFQKLFERAETEWDARPTAEWIITYARHIDNVRASLNWAFSAGGDATVGVALTAAAVPLWFELSLVDECVGWIERGLAALDAVPGQVVERRTMQLNAALGWLQMYASAKVENSVAAWKVALRMAEKLGDTDYQLRALWALWADRMNHDEYRESLPLASRFRGLAAEAGDTADRLVGDRMTGFSLHFLGNQTGARECIERMLGRYVPPVSRSHTVQFHFDQRVTAHIMLARILWLQGFADQALRNVESNIEHAVSINHTLSLANALAQAACPVALLAGDFAAAEHYIEMLRRHTTMHALDVWHAQADCFDGELAIRRGNPDRGLSLLRAAVAYLQRAGFVQYQTVFLLALARGLASAGEPAAGRAVVEDALVRCEATGESWCLAELQRVRGETLLLEEAPGCFEAAETAFLQSLSTARAQNVLSWELRSAMSLGRLWQRRRRAGARDLLASVYARFSEGFGTADLIDAAALLDQLDHPTPRAGIP